MHTIIFVFEQRQFFLPFNQYGFSVLSPVELSKGVAQKLLCTNGSKKLHKAGMNCRNVQINISLSNEILVYKRPHHDEKIF